VVLNLRNRKSELVDKSDEELLLENLEMQEILENEAIELSVSVVNENKKQSPANSRIEALVSSKQNPNKAERPQVLIKSNARGVLLMSDSRDPREPQGEIKKSSWWWASAYLAAVYARLTGDEFIFYQVIDICIGPDGISVLSPPWCKVKAMIQAMREYPNAQFFLYLDSDAAISEKFFWNSSLTILAATWLDNVNKPILLNQDAKSFWCANALPRQGHDDRHCLNAGIVFWRRHPLALQFLHTWWNTSVYQNDPYSIRARNKWPWEQNGLQHAAQRLPAATTIVPHPERFHLFWPGRRGCIKPMCFAHLIEACCVIDHHCANRNDKFRLAQRAYSHVTNNKKRNLDDAILLQSSVRPLIMEIDRRSLVDKARAAALLSNTGMIPS